MSRRPCQHFEREPTSGLHVLQKMSITDLPRTIISNGMCFMVCACDVGCFRCVQFVTREKGNRTQQLHAYLWNTLLLPKVVLLVRPKKQALGAKAIASIWGHLLVILILEQNNCSNFFAQRQLFYFNNF